MEEKWDAIKRVAKIMADISSASRAEVQDRAGQSGGQPDGRDAAECGAGGSGGGGRESGVNRRTP